MIIGFGRISRCAAAALLAVSVVIVAPSAAGALTRSDTLYSGQAIEAGTATDHLESVNKLFTLSVWSRVIQLSERVPFQNGYSGDFSYWERADPTGQRIGGHDQSYLRLQTDGNLVLREHTGHLLWSTHTTGAHNRVVLEWTGDIVMVNGAGHVLWHSGTGAYAIGAGHRLSRGQSLIAQPVQGATPYIVDRITMEPNGDLVLLCNGHIGWQTNTHVAGSYLVMQTDGNLVLRTPGGNAVWSSHTAGTSSMNYFSISGVSGLSTLRTYWIFPASRYVTC